jgi:hypothetical protein
MAGARGPVPKRTDQRRRTNKDPAGPVTKGAAAPRVTVPAASSEWNSIARRWYASLKLSGESQWYEPSDWMHAWVSAEMLSRMLEADKLSAMLYASWSSDTARLLVTEGDRRRLRMELEREKAADPDADAGVAQMDAWRARLGSSS